MVLGRIWNFAKRHRKKLIFTTAIVGGAYITWNVVLPKLQERLMKKLLAELTQGAAGGQAGSTEEAQRKSFEHKQKVSDAYARRRLAALRAKQNTQFAEEACTARLKAAQGKEAKFEAFKAFQVECLAKAASAVYMFHLALLLHRVGFNIAGRELGVGGIESQSDDKMDVHESFLQLLGHMEDSSARIADAIRKAVRDCVVEFGVEPTTPVGQKALEKLIVKSCREANKELLAESKGASLLLPDNLDETVAQADRPGVKRLLDEARDYLDSPHFLQVFEVAAARGAQLFSQGLEQELAGGTGVTGPWPMAKFFGPLTKLAGSILDDSGDGDFSAQAFTRYFAEEPRLAEFCEGLFLQSSRT
mmetsp:Transcript_32938/g.94601  ORF Transcript_32938/g.94601 Transcript_32938/m.94601 type:complete len:361 (-) Transcript_32938:94-1176(-)